MLVRRRNSGSSVIGSSEGVEYPSGRVFAARSIDSEHRLDKIWVQSLAAVAGPSHLGHEKAGKPVGHRPGDDDYWAVPPQQRKGLGHFNYSSWVSGGALPSSVRTFSTSFTDRGSPLPCIRLVTNIRPKDTMEMIRNSF